MCWQTWAPCPTPVRGRATRRAPAPAIELSSFLFTPSRPGALLREARARRLIVG